MQVVSLLSGGLDSSVLLAHLLEDGRDVLPMWFNYGQRHSKEERSAEFIASYYGLALTKVDLSAYSKLWGASVLVDSPDNPAKAIPHGHYAADNMKATVVPNRNMIMLAIAAAWCITNKADGIAIAAHAGDHTVYPDCRPEFYEALGGALRLCDFHQVNLYRPFLAYSKASIASRGSELKVPMHRTWSCYEGGELHCGKCGTCVERIEAFQLAEVVDLTPYAR